MKTTRVAQLFQVHPQSIHVAVMRTGQFRGIVPKKLKNRTLSWPENEIRALVEEERRCGVKHDASLIPQPELPAKMISGADITMSSREIAELTGKRHPDVRRDIRTMLESLGIDVSIFAHIYKDTSRRNQEEFNLPKRETLILVSGYNVQMRAKIIDRWQELEAQLQPKATPQIPQTLSEALLLASKLLQSDSIEKA